MFGIFSSVGMKISAVVIVVLLSVGAAGYWYFTGTIKAKDQEIKELNEANTILKTANAGLTAQVEANEKSQKLITGINKSLQDIKAQGGKLQDLYAEHDLEKLAAKKPGLIERRVNSAVSNMLKDIEDMSKPEAYTRDQPVIGDPAKDKKEKPKDGKKDE